MAEQRRFDGYIRVSQVAGREGDSFISPAVQRETIERWAALRGVTIDAFHEDLDVSGGRLDRPGLDRLMGRIRAGQTGGVVVAKLDRLSRAGVADALNLVQEIHDCDAQLAAVDLGVDPTTPFGEFGLTLMLALARMERRRISENWDVANADAIRRGIHFTAQVPFGYRRGEDKRLVPHEPEADIIRRLFELRAEHASWRDLAVELTRQAPRAEGREWSSRSAAKMIQSRVYLGEAWHGQHRNPDAHPAIVTLPEWEAANAVTGGPSGLPTGDGALLRGLIRCAGCGYAMRRTKATYRDGNKRLIYSCAVRHTGGKCQSPGSAMAHLIEPLVVREVMLWVGHDPYEVDGEPGAAPSALEDAQRALADAKARQATYLADDELREVVSREAFLEGARKRQAAVDEAEAALVAARGHAQAVERASTTLWEDWAEWEVAERNQALRQVLDAVYVRQSGRRSNAPLEDRTMILFAGENDNELPRRGSTSYRSQPVPWPGSLRDPHGVNVPGLVAKLSGEGDVLYRTADGRLQAIERRYLDV